MKINLGLILIFIIALWLRFALVFVGYHGDLNNNISWADIAYERGLNGFYGSDDANDWPYSAPNQPPLTILLFTSLRFVWDITARSFNYLNKNFQKFPSRTVWFWEESGMILLVKLPSILADLAIGYLIFKYLNKSKKYKNKAFLISSIWLFNPLTFYNSSIWGQTDSIVNLIGLIAIFALHEKRLIKFCIFITLSLLFKGSLSLFLPILFVFALKQKHNIKTWGISAISSLLIIIATSIWFHPALSLPIWLFNLYKDRILPGEIGYLTANAFNFWWFIDPGKVLDSTKFLGITYRVIGFMITFTALSLISFWLVKNKITDKRLFISLAITSLVSFLFMTRMHERYLYPFFPIATLILAQVTWFIPIYVVLSLVHLLNLFHLFWVPTIDGLRAIYQYQWFTDSLAFITLICLFISLRLFKASKI